jgi:hypothetical protein
MHRSKIHTGKTLVFLETKIVGSKVNFVEGVIFDLIFDQIKGTFSMEYSRVDETAVLKTDDRPISHPQSYWLKTKTLMRQASHRGTPERV